jgi:hypothetical protein
MVPEPSCQAKARHGRVAEGRRVLPTRACRRRGRRGRTPAHGGGRRCLTCFEDNVTGRGAGVRGCGSRCRRWLSQNASVSAPQIWSAPPPDGIAPAAAAALPAQQQRGGLAAEVVRGRVATDQSDRLGRINLISTRSVYPGRSHVRRKKSICVGGSKDLLEQSITCHHSSPIS